MLRDAAHADHAAVLRLNHLSVHFLNPMDAARLKKLAAAACYFRVLELDGQVAAFLLGFRKGADYDSANFQWFEAHGGDFIYIDRIVLGEQHRGRRLGDQLYADIERYARSVGAPRLTAEIDIAPPNPVSLRFHDRWGFVETGQHAPYDGKKIVSLREKRLGSTEAVLAHERTGPR